MSEEDLKEYLNKIFNDKAKNSDIFPTEVSPGVFYLGNGVYTGKGGFDKFHELLQGYSKDLLNKLEK